MLIESSRKFVKNYNIGNLGFVTCFMDSDLKIIHGIALVKQSDMKVFICSFLNNKRHGHCLTFQHGRLITLENYEEGELVDLPITYKQD